MPKGSQAIKTAIDLLHLPSEVRRIRSEPLPKGIERLLRVAASENEAIEEASQITGRSEKVIVESSTFFIEQILFAPDASSYRVLGANSDASFVELRRNMALLIRWLHPDLDTDDERSVFIGRVTSAWDDLKTKERRINYDATRVGTQRPKYSQSNETNRQKKHQLKTAHSPHRTNGHSMRSNRTGRVVATYQFNAPGRLRRVLLQLLGGRRS